MRIIIGLGNPGEKYKKTRHNAGFIILDEVQEKFEFPKFSLNKKFNALISEGNIGENKIILIKPQTFMNNSGETVRAVFDFYKPLLSELVIINDDLDIIVGNYKVSLCSSARGHNGVQNIIDHLGTQEIKRIKIGVEQESGRSSRKISGEEFVLKNFSEDEYEKIKALAGKIKTDLI